MSDENNDDDLKSLRSENAKLQRENESLQKLVRAAENESAKLGDQLRDANSEAKDRRHEAKELRAQLKERDDLIAAKESELNEIAEGHVALENEYSQFKAQAEAAPNELLEQVNKYKGELRKTRHDMKYDKILGEIKVKDERKRADLLKLAGYEPEDDEPDETKIRDAFMKVVQDRPWLIDADPVAVETPNPAPTPAATPPANGHTNGKVVAAATPAADGKPGPGNDRGSSLASTQAQPSSRVPGRL